MKIFLYENHQVVLNKEEIALVKEFAEVLSLKFNTGEAGDKDGRKRIRAHKVFTYVYLVYDWQSPYAEFSNKEKREAALEDSQLDPKILETDEVKNVIKKYLDIQDTRLVRLLKAGYDAIDKLRDYFTFVDLHEIDPVSGKPIHAAKDLMSNLNALGKTVDSVQQLEHMVKKEKARDKGLRGDAEAGLFDNE